MCSLKNNPVISPPYETLKAQGSVFWRKAKEEGRLCEDGGMAGKGRVRKDVRKREEDRTIPAVAVAESRIRKTGKTETTSNKQEKSGRKDWCDN